MTGEYAAFDDQLSACDEDEKEDEKVADDGVVPGVTETLCQLHPAVVRRVRRMIGALQTHLESAIDSEIVPGTNDAMPDRRELLAGLRTEWQQGEDAVKVLEAEMERVGEACQEFDCVECDCIERGDEVECDCRCHPPRRAG